ncbi:MAG: DUF3179 domain-containing protein [Pikeienuella sp.]
MPPRPLRRPTRRSALAAALGGAVALTLPAPRAAAVDNRKPAAIDAALRDLIYGNRATRQSALRHLALNPRTDLAPSLIFALRFARGDRLPIVELLTQATGEAGPDDWFGWMLWQEAHPEISARPALIDLKREIYLAVDPDFAVFLRPEYLVPEKMRIRFEEVAWGGVPKDGIPALDAPKMVNAEAAHYLRDDDLVFGVEVGGDARAYPLRIMGWHEMLNDVVGGVPLSLAYCTLCGAGILFETQLPDRPAPFIFGSSGFLYRSNKLMFDRQTHSLWNQFTGEPVIGPLAESGIGLAQRPVAIAQWSDWRAANPTTTVLSLDTGHLRDYGSGVVYRAYFDSPELMFPARGGAAGGLAQKDYVFGIRRRAAARAWPLSAFAGGAVINDKVGDLDVVLVGDAAGRTVRAYERDGRRFGRGPQGSLISDGTWRITEAALIGPNGAGLPRVAGHVAYWFAWDGYLGPRSSLYRSPL